MDFWTDEELHGYLDLILFYVKREKSLPSKNLKIFLLREIFKKESSVRTI